MRLYKRIYTVCFIKFIIPSTLNLFLLFLSYHWISHKKIIFKVEDLIFNLGIVKLTSFRSSLQSHPLWVTLYFEAHSVYLKIFSVIFKIRSNNVNDCRYSKKKEWNGKYETFIVYSLQRTLFSVQFTIYTVYTVLSVQFTVYTQCSVSSLQRTVYSLLYIQCWLYIHSVECTVYFIYSVDCIYTVLSVKFTAYTVLTVYTQCWVYSLLCIHSVECTAYCIYSVDCIYTVLSV